MIVFVHIEKAAGTTLNHILRCNFPLAHYDVRPFSSKSNHIFQPDDFRKTLKINPFIKSISGHSIYPFIPLSVIKSNLKYITIIRDPVQRYISRYHYLKHKFFPELTFENFLNDKTTFNFQTKKIAGTANIETAKKILAEKFFLVGITEEFDTFLIILEKKLNSIKFDPRYKIQNRAVNIEKYLQTKERLMNTFLNEIIDRNKSDIEIYNYVKYNLFPRAKVEYGENLEDDLKKFKQSCKSFTWPPIRYIDYIYRKIYINPVTGLIRLKNKLPYRGSY